jgi:hypothetical protein
MGGGGGEYPKWDAILLKKAVHLFVYFQFFFFVLPFSGKKGKLASSKHKTHTYIRVG